MFRRLFVKKMAVAAIAATAMFAAPQAYAEYPDKPIKIVIGFSAGGATDTLGRLVGKALEEKHNTPVIVENLPGGGGMVAASKLIKLPADGYTVSLVADLSIAAAPLITDKISYKVDDFEYITTVSRFQTAFYVKKDAPFQTWEEMIAYGKKGNELTVASPTPVVKQYFDYVAKKDGIKITSVPVKGGKGVVKGVLGGHMDIGFSVGVHQRLVKDDSITVIGIPLDERLATTPDVPTMKELGYEHNIDGYFVFVAPKGIPEDTLKAMSDLFQKAAASDDVKNLAAEKMNLPNVVLTSEETSTLMHSLGDGYTALFSSTK